MEGREVLEGLGVVGREILKGRENSSLRGVEWSRFTKKDNQQQVSGFCEDSNEH